MGSLSPVHWFIVFIVVFLLFGSSRLPGVVRGFGEGIRAFKKGLDGEPDGPKPAPKEFDGKVETKPESKT